MPSKFLQKTVVISSANHQRPPRTFFSLHLMCMWDERLDLKGLLDSTLVYMCDDVSTAMLVRRRWFTRRNTDSFAVLHGNDLRLC